MQSSTILLRMFRRDESDHIKLASQILREAREELGRADGKAGLLLAAAGVGIGAVLAGLLAQDWDPAKLHDSVEWLWWIGTIAGLCGPVALSCAVWPRTTYRKNRNPKKVAFFGDVVGLSETGLGKPPALYGGLTWFGCYRSAGAGFGNSR